MAKILTDKEMAEIIHRAVNDETVIDCADSYQHFLEDLAELVADHFGAVAGTVEGIEEENGRYGIAFNKCECTPPNGGIFADYDKDVSWADPEPDTVEGRG